MKNPTIKLLGLRSVIFESPKTIDAPFDSKSVDVSSQSAATTFFVHLILWLVGYQFLLGIFIEFGASFKNQAVYDMLNPLMMFMLGIGTYMTALRSGIPLEHYGLNLNNWKSNVKEALLWTCVFLIGMLGFKWLLIHFIPFYHGKSMIDHGVILQYDVYTCLLIYILYVILVPVQEFVVRGVIQGSLERFLTGKNSGFLALILSNLIFSGFHIHYDLKFAIMTFFSGLFWGILYRRQGSLLGVSISHLMIGLFALLCLGLA